MKKILKIVSLNFLLLLSGACARTWMTRLPYISGAYAFEEPLLGDPAYSFKHYMAISEEEKDAQEFKKKRVTAFAMGYRRTISYAFDAGNGEKTSLAHLFHGASSFKLAHVLKDATVLDSGSVGTSLTNISANPWYRYKEKGALLGFNMSYGQEIAGKDVVFQMQARLPIKSICMHNQGDALTLSLDETRAAYPSADLVQIKTETGTSGAYEAFAARLDFLKEKGLLDFNARADQSYAVISGAFDVTGVSSATSNPPQLSFATIDNSRALIKQGAFMYESVDHVAPPHDFDTLSYSHLTQVAVADLSTLTDGQGSLPVELYSSVQNGTGDVSGNGDNYTVYPVVVATIAPTSTPYAVDAHTGNLLSSHLPYTSYPLVGFRSSSPTTRVAQVEFGVPPVILQKPLSASVPATFGKYINLPADVENSGTALYDSLSSYNPGSSVAFLSSTGDFVDGSGSAKTGADTAVFWYLNDYTALESNDAALSQLYATTSLDSTEAPTPESANLLAVLKQFVPPVTPSLEIGYSFLAGDYRNGFNEDGTPRSSSLPSRAPSYLNFDPIRWDSFEKKGLGDLDLCLNMVTSWYEGRLVTSLLGGIVLPTASVVKPYANYLAVPLGNNGHFEVRTGLQAACNLTSWVRLAGFSMYSWALKASESFIAPFAGAKAFGLHPAFVTGSVSWQELILAADLTLTPLDVCGLDLGYQYTLKEHDQIMFDVAAVKDGIGQESKELSAAFLAGMSKREAHKIKTSIFCNVTSDFTLSLGWDCVIAGRNIGKENDLYATIALQF